MKLGTLKKSTTEIKSIAIELEDETLNLQYSNGAYTPRVERQLKSAEADKMPATQTATLLSAGIVGWDMVADKDFVLEPYAPFEHLGRIEVKVGDVIPLDPRFFDQELGIEGMAFLIEKIFADQSPKSPTSDQSETF